MAIINQLLKCFECSSTSAMKTLVILSVLMGFNTHLLVSPDNPISPDGLYQAPSISSGRSPPPPISNPMFIRYSQFMERVKREYSLSNMYESTREVIQDQFSTLVNQLMGENDPKSVNVSPNQSESATSDSDVNIRDKRDDSSPHELAAETLEAILYFTNGLILTEAVATNQVNVTHIATDLMIIGQMATYDDWIDVVGSANVDDATKQRIEEHFEKLHELWNVIENGFQETLNTDLIATTISVMERIPIIGKVIDDTRNFDELLTRFAKRFFFYGTDHEKTLRSLVKLPNALKDFQKLNSSSNALDSVRDGMTFIIEFAYSNTSSHLSEAMKLCMNVDEKSDIIPIGSCLRKLKEGFQNLTIPDNSTLNSLLDAKIVFDLLGIQTSGDYWKKLISIGGSFNTTANVWRLLTTFVEQRSTSIANNKEFRLLVANLEDLKTSIEDLKLIEKSLSKLQPVQLIVEEFIRIHESINSTSSNLSKKSFIPNLKRYKGLPNGILSIEELSKRIGPADLFPPQMFTSKVVQRVDVLKTWVTQLTPIVGSSGSFQHIPYLLDIIAGVIETIEDKIPADLVKKLDEVESFYKKIPPIGTIQTTLANVFEMITDFQKNDWENGFVKILEGFVGTSQEVERISKLLNPLPDCISFASKIKSAIQPYVKETDQYKTALLSVKKMAEEFPKGIEIANKLQAVIDKISIAYIENMDVSDDLKNIKEKMKKSFVFNMSNLKENDYDEDQIFTDLENCETSYLSMSSLNKNKYPIADFLSNVKIIKIPSTSISKPADPIDVQPTVDLVKELEKPRNINTKLEPSDAISKLMNGTSGTGIETLELIQPGVIGYRRFVDGMESLAIWESEIIKSRTKRQTSDEELINEVKSLMEGLKPVQLSNSIKPSVYGTLNNISTLIDPLSQFRDSLKKIKSADVPPIATKLKAAWGSSTDSLKNRKWKVYRMVSSVNEELADKIKTLISGFKNLHSSLSYVDCSKMPDQPVCIVAPPPQKYEEKNSENSSNSALQSIGTVAGTLILGMIIIVPIVLCIIKRIKRKTEEKFEKRLQGTAALAKEIEQKYAEVLERLKEKLEKNEPIDANMLRETAELRERYKKARRLDGIHTRLLIDEILVAAFNSEASPDQNAYESAVRAQFNEIGRASDANERQETVKLQEGKVRFHKRALYAENRVILKDDDENNIRLHASYIDLNALKYIAMQAPLSHAEDKRCNEEMFKMIMEKSVGAVVQFCQNENEGFSPIDYTNEKLEYTSFKLEKLLTKKCGSWVETKFRITLKDIEPNKDEKQRTHEFIHFHFNEWPDRMAPKEPEDVLKLAKKINEIAEKNYVVVHCQAGSGRTMSFIAIAYLLYEWTQLKNEDSDILFVEVVIAMRRKRYAAIQTEIQLAFIELVVALFMSEIPNEKQKENKKRYEDLFELYTKCYSKLCRKVKKDKKQDDHYEEKVKKVEEVKRKKKKSNHNLTIVDKPLSVREKSRKELANVNLDKIAAANNMTIVVKDDNVTVEENTAVYNDIPLVPTAPAADSSIKTAPA